jgi:arylsulfatase A-like enzyme
VAADRSFDGPVSLHDLTATFLEAAALAPLPEMDSRSLAPVLSGATTHHRDYVISGLVTPRQGWHLAYDGRYKLVRETDGTERLFDLQEDPWEDADIAAATPDVAARLRTWLLDETLDKTMVNCP